MKIFEDYYESYWVKRKAEEVIPPIRKSIPRSLRKYTTYGAILNRISPNSKILDIGCGDGNVSQLYLRRGQVYGLDISMEALEAAKKRGIETVNHDLNKLPLPFENDFFDTIILTDVIEHVINPLELISEVRRVLKKNGKIIITVPNFSRFANRLRMFFWGDPIDLLHWSKYGDEIEHLHWFTKPKISWLLRKKEFREIKFVPTGIPDSGWGVIGLPGLGKMICVEGKK